MISSHTNVNTITQHSHEGQRGEGCKRDEHASNRIDSCETVVLCAYWETADTHSCASSRHRAFLEHNNHNNYTVPQSTSLSPQPLTSPSADTRLPGETEYLRLSALPTGRERGIFVCSTNTHTQTHTHWNACACVMAARLAPRGGESREAYMYVHIYR